MGRRAKLDRRCRCPHPSHNGMCPRLAEFETVEGVALCGDCSGGHLPLPRRRGLKALAGAALLLVTALGGAGWSAAHTDGPAERATIRLHDAYSASARWHARVFEDGSARVCYRARVYFVRRQAWKEARVCGSVGVPW